MIFVCFDDFVWWSSFLNDFSYDSWMIFVWLSRILVWFCVMGWFWNDFLDLLFVIPDWFWSHYVWSNGFWMISHDFQCFSIDFWMILMERFLFDFSMMEWFLNDLFGPIACDFWLVFEWLCVMEWFLNGFSIFNDVWLILMEWFFEKWFRHDFWLILCDVVFLGYFWMILQWFLNDFVRWGIWGNCFWTIFVIFCMISEFFEWLCVMEWFLNDVWPTFESVCVIQCFGMVFESYFVMEVFLTWMIFCPQIIIFKISKNRKNPKSES